MFQGKSVWVGGAGQGIGRASAQSFLAQGAEVWALNRDPTGLASPTSDRVHTTTLDMAAPQIGEALTRWPPKGVDILVNNAVIPASQPLHLTKDAGEVLAVDGSGAMGRFPRQNEITP